MAITITITGGVMKLDGLNPSPDYISASNGLFTKDILGQYALYDSVLKKDYLIGSYENINGVASDAELEDLLSGFFSKPSDALSTLNVGDVDGGNYTSWNENGELRCYGDATQWDDLRVSVNSTSVNGSNPPTDALFKDDGQEIPGDAYALSFLSTSQGNLLIPDDVTFDTSNDFTFGFWVRPVVNTQNNIECVRKQGVFELDFVGSNQFNLNISGVGSSTGSLQFNRGVWNYIQIMHDATEQEVYLFLNNNLAITISASAVVDNTSIIQFNRQETLFDIDYVEYWDSILTPADRASRYNSGAGDQLTGSEVGLKGLWELNDGSGTVVVEKTGISSNGSISGGTEGSQWDWIGGHVGNTSAGSRGVILKYFSPDVVNELYFDVQLPHRWKQGSDIEAHLHFVPNADGLASHDVRWGLEYTWASIGDVFGNTTTIYGNINHLAETLVKDKHYITELGEISATGKTFSSMLCCRIFRDVENVGDTFEDFAGLLEIDFHYQIDSLGSNEEYVKY